MDSIGLNSGSPIKTHSFSPPISDDSHLKMINALFKPLNVKNDKNLEDYAKKISILTDECNKVIKTLETTYDNLDQIKNEKDKNHQFIANIQHNLQKAKNVKKAVRVGFVFKTILITFLTLSIIGLFFLPLTKSNLHIRNQKVNANIKYNKIKLSEAKKELAELDREEKELKQQNLIGRQQEAALYWKITQYKQAIYLLKRQAEAEVA